MRLAIISDIHGNFEAFQQVLEDIDRLGVDEVISLGDNIGYGPEPDRVIEQIRTRRIPSVQGNHELALKDVEYLNWFNPAARKSLMKTRELLSEESYRFITKLEPFLISYGCRFVHGFPPDSPLIYVFQVSDSSKIEVFKKTDERLCFIGHTHTLEIISCDGQKLEYHDLPEGLTGLDREKKYIINIGSVGQPRDDSSDAKYVIWDSSEDTIDVRFISYDIAGVVRKIQEAGLPEEHAKRLW
ncbi:MAG: metallophosphoesterase [Desulfobacterales bacterium]|nr:MAG: metallophosphoesterase [Desulfobacterales bacterium]